jgi:hypothetical protein
VVERVRLGAGACRITVDGEPYFWRDGEPVMFDETFILFDTPSVSARRPPLSRSLAVRAAR